MERNLGNILHVDDNELMRVALQKRLEKDGYHVYSVSLAHKAPNLLREIAIDLAIIDVRMPEMTGFELLKVLREIKPDLPIVILTGLKDSATLYQSFESGANVLIEKPASGRYIEEQVRRLINGRKSYSSDADAAA